MFVSLLLLESDFNSEGSDDRHVSRHSETSFPPASNGADDAEISTSAVSESRRLPSAEPDLIELRVLTQKSFWMRSDPEVGARTRLSHQDVDLSPEVSFYPDDVQMDLTARLHGDEVQSISLGPSVQESSGEGQVNR